MSSSTLNPNLSAKQALRLRRSLMALFGGFCHTTICCFLFYFDYFHINLYGFLILFSFISLVNISFPVMIWTNLNLRFKDPSLTFQMMFWAITVVLVTLYFASLLRPLLLMFCPLVMIFGFFNLKKRSFLFLSIYSIVLYGTIIFISKFTIPNFDTKGELILFMGYFLVISCFMMVAMEIADVKMHLKYKTGALEDHLKQIRFESLTDELTGVNNRRFMINVLERQQFLAQRKERYSFSACMLDLDYFKNINDTFGHAVGDSVLKEFTHKISEHLRKTDYFARVGGEEFLLVAPFSNQKEIEALAERMRQAIENLDLSHIIPNLKITVSIGGSIYRDSESVDDMMKRVDKALYDAKNSGRNKVIIK